MLNKRTPLKRRVPMPRNQAPMPRQPMNKRSKRRGLVENLDVLWRAYVLGNDSHKCAVCGVTEPLHAHHVFSRQAYPHLRHDTRNGVTLCAVDHALVHAQPAAGVLILCGIYGAKAWDELYQLAHRGGKGHS